MGKITFKYKKGIISISNKLSGTEMVNEKLIQQISDESMRGIVFLEKKHKAKKTMLEACIKGHVPLDEYLKGVISKRTFFYIVNGVLDIIRLCEKNQLNTNNLYLEPAHCFFQPEKQTMLVVYWPVVNNSLSASVGSFFTRLGEMTILSEGEDHAFLVEYRKSLSSPQPFSLKEFEQLINRLSGVKNSRDVFANESISTKTNYTDSSKKIEYDPLSLSMDNPNINAVPDMSHAEASISRKNVCPKCGAENPPNINLCFHCGSEFL